MKPPRGLNADEAELWARVARTVTPLVGRKPPAAVPSVNPLAQQSPAGGAKVTKAILHPIARPRVNSASAPAPRKAPTPLDRQTLDSSWERKLSRAALAPDFTLDLHGATIDGAHARLDHGLSQAKAMGARLVLVVTGKARPVEAADRSSKRGVIRAKILDWLAAGPHASAIAAIRPAHRRHGGAGALYIVLRRAR